MLSKQRINIEQLSLQCDEVLVQNQQLEQIVEEAFRRAPELEIAIDLLVGVRIHTLASGFHEAKEEVMRIQLELNLMITKLQLKAQPSMPPEVRE